MKGASKRDLSGRRKRRTRQHVIADLSVNHVERFVLFRGHSTELVRRDYGLDLLIFFHDKHGYLLDGHVSVQVKATDHPRYTARRRAVCVAIDRRDLDAWRGRLEPVILVLYDPRANRAFWLYVQADSQKPVLRTRGRTTLRIPTSQRLDEYGIDHFAAYNAQLVERLRKMVRYETTHRQIR